MDRREAFHVLASVDHRLVHHELLERDGTTAIDALSYGFCNDLPV
ncbi:hypothetical protein [Halobiforma nitratireducens]|nr:hypothetical protein [Halobiforma nitratireducens]